MGGCVGSEEQTPDSSLVKPRPLKEVNKYVFKFLLVGDSGVGKTSLVLRYADNAFSDAFVSTIGVDFKVRNSKASNKAEVTTQLWDTAGQERFRAVVSSYYRGAHGVVIVFDLTNRESFTNLKYWIQNVAKYAEENTMTIIVGNKCDIAEDRQVSTDEAQQFAASVGFPYFETSAKQSIGVEEAFLKIIDTLVERTNQ